VSFFALHIRSSAQKGKKKGKRRQVSSELTGGKKEGEEGLLIIPFLLEEKKGGEGVALRPEMEKNQRKNQRFLHCCQKLFST